MQSFTQHRGSGASQVLDPGATAVNTTVVTPAPAAPWAGRELGAQGRQFLPPASGGPGPMGHSDCAGLEDSSHTGQAPTKALS